MPLQAEKETAYRCFTAHKNASQRRGDTFNSPQLAPALLVALFSELVLDYPLYSRKAVNSCIKLLP